MEATEIDLVELQELDLPDLIFKYRDWEKPFNKTIITSREVFMASPKEFPDPLDCKIPIRYDLLTEKQIFQKYLHMSMKDNPRRNRKQHRAFASSWLKKTPIKNMEYIKRQQERYFNDFSQRFGVLSLTDNPSNDEMWNSYSNEHKGFCVGFKTIALFNSIRPGGGGPVEYYEKMPVILPTPFHSFSKQHLTQIFQKEIKWLFEKEYRTHIFSSLPLSQEERTIKVPAEAYSKIIIGKKMPKKLKEEFKRSIPAELTHVEVIELRDK